MSHSKIYCKIIKPQVVLNQQKLFILIVSQLSINESDQIKWPINILTCIKISQCSTTTTTSDK